jgi:hypothetical protein
VIDFELCFGIPFEWSVAVTDIVMVVSEVNKSGRYDAIVDGVALPRTTAVFTNGAWELLAG